MNNKNINLFNGRFSGEQGYKLIEGILKLKLQFYENKFNNADEIEDIKFFELKIKETTIQFELIRSGNSFKYDLICDIVLKNE